METIGYQIVVTTILEEKASRYFCTADENLLVAEENGCIRKTSDHETPKFCEKNKSEELHIVEVKYDAMGNLTCVLDMDGYEYALTVRSHAIPPCCRAMGLQKPDDFGGDGQTVRGYDALQKHGGFHSLGNPSGWKKP